MSSEEKTWNRIVVISLIINTYLKEFVSIYIPTTVMNISLYQLNKNRSNKDQNRRHLDLSWSSLQLLEWVLYRADFCQYYDLISYIGDYLGLYVLPVFSVVWGLCVILLIRLMKCSVFLHWFLPSGLDNLGPWEYHVQILMLLNRFFLLENRIMGNAHLDLEFST